MRLLGSLAIAIGCAVSSIAAKSSSGSWHHHNRHHHQQAAKQAAAHVAAGHRSQGIYTPNGSVLRSFPIRDTGISAPVFWTSTSWPNTVDISSTAQTAYIMVHGRLRNGGQYWDLMHNALLQAVHAKVADVSANSIVVAPQFWAADADAGKYLSNELAWSNNGWSGADLAIVPQGTNLSSIDVLDALVQEFQNATRYPRLRNILIAGHGGGGQLLQRYALLGQDSTLPVRYVIANPSSAVYFTTDRSASDADKLACPTYNQWRYGFDGFNRTSMSISDLFSRYVQRDVINVVSLNDTSDSGDQSCAALLQNSSKRATRNLTWWKYINSLAKSSEDVSGFPGDFQNLPDWSALLSGGTFNQHLVVVPNVPHNPFKVFRSAQGRSALFGVKAGDILSGWRPISQSSYSSSTASSTASSIVSNIATQGTISTAASSTTDSTFTSGSLTSVSSTLTADASTATVSASGSGSSSESAGGSLSRRNNTNGLRGQQSRREEIRIIRRPTRRST